MSYRRPWIVFRKTTKLAPNHGENESIRRKGRNSLRMTQGWAGSRRMKQFMGRKVRTP